MGHIKLQWLIKLHDIQISYYHDAYIFTANSRPTQSLLSPVHEGTLSQR